MVDIQSAAADIRRGIQKKERNHMGKNIMACPIPYGGHKTGFAQKIRSVETVLREE